MLNELKDIALTIYIDPVNSVGHAAKVNTILKVLGKLNESYYNYLEVEFLKKDDFKAIYNTNNKVLDTLKEELDLFAVDVKFSSFQISVAPNLVSPQTTLFKPEVVIWQKETFDDYKENIIKGDFQDPKYLSKILKRYNETERAKIFQPFFSAINDSKNYSVNVLNKTGSIERVLRPPAKDKLSLYLPKPVLQEEIPDDKTVMAYLKVKQSKGAVDIKKSKIKKVLYQEEMEYDIYPFRPDTIRYDGKIILLNEKLSCDVEFNNNIYYIKYKPLDITVWAASRDDVEEAFAFSFFALYENIFLEDNSRLSKNAIAIKKKFKKLINKFLNEG